MNRCAHRGAQIVRRTHGNAKEHVCIYHRWCYNLRRLIGIPFRRGLKGEGGMPADFDLKAASPRRMTLRNFHGVLFGTFAAKTEPLEEYLGEFGTGMVRRFMHKPIRVLGYSRQMVNGNWKLYAENLRDTYHASLLHEFFVTYGVDRATQRGGVKMDARHRQHESRLRGDRHAGGSARRVRGRPVCSWTGCGCEFSLLKYVPEFADGMNLAAPTIFPNMLLIQINNTLGTRQIRPKGVDSFEIFQTLFGYVDDSEEMTRHRLLLANLVGRAGFVWMEDGEAIEIIQKATHPETTASAVFEMGGRGALKDLAHRVTETPIRGFWSYWSELMGVEPEGAIRDRLPPGRPKGERPSAEREGSPSGGIPRDVRDAIADLLAEYALRLDEDRLEEWIDLFDADCSYKVVTRENVEQDLPNILIWCANQDMLRDRVASYRDVNEYNLHWDRHVDRRAADPGRRRRRLARRGRLQPVPDRPRGREPPLQRRALPGVGAGQRRRRPPAGDGRDRRYRLDPDAAGHARLGALPYHRRSPHFLPR